MAAMNAATVVETRWGLSRWVVVLLTGCWVVAVGATLCLDAALGKRFLDMPLSALVAGQGALFAVALFVVQASADPRADD